MLLIFLKKNFDLIYENHHIHFPHQTFYSNSRTMFSNKNPLFQRQNHFADFHQKTFNLKSIII